MASRRFCRELSDELPIWQERGWVSPAHAAEIRATYALADSGPNLGPILRALFGALLVGGGMILLLAHNWNELPRGVRVAFAFAPLLATLGAGAWVLRSKADRVAWCESIALLNSLAVALAISLVAQVYQISGDTPRFVLTWALLTLPGAILLRSGATWVLFQILSVSWACLVDDRDWLILGYVPLVAASLIIFILPSWRLSRPATLRAVQLPLFLAVSVGMAAMFWNLRQRDWIVSGHLLWFGLVTIVTSKNGTTRAGVTSWLARLGLGGFLLALTYSDFWNEGSGYGWRLDSQEKLIRGIALFLILASALGVILARRFTATHRTDLLWSAAGGLGIVLAACHALIAPTVGIPLVANLGVAALGVETLRRALHERDFSRLNLGWLLLSALILSRFFDSDWSYLARGLAFIVLGLGFLGWNGWLRKKGVAS